MTVEQFRKYTGTYSPQRTDDLKPSMAQFIGQTGTFKAMWEIEEGKYHGQWALELPYAWMVAIDGDAIWLPHLDLADMAPAAEGCKP